MIFQITVMATNDESRSPTKTPTINTAAVSILLDEDAPSVLRCR